MSIGLIWSETFPSSCIRMLTCFYSLFLPSRLFSSHSQVIKATIERHKQNSETFNKAFNSSFSREDDHVSESPVSHTHKSFHWHDPVDGSRCAVNHVRPLMRGLIIVSSLSARTASPCTDVVVWYSHRKKLFISTCCICGTPLSNDLIGKAQVRVYTELLWIFFYPLRLTFAGSQPSSCLTQTRGPAPDGAGWHLVVEVL